MKPVIKSEIFKNSFFYIGAGFDFEPLHRFSNISPVFIYLNLWNRKKQVLQRISSDLSDSPFVSIKSIEIYDDFDELDYCEYDTANYESHIRKFESILTRHESESYRKAFLPAIQERQWMIKLELVRKHTGKKIKLYYITAEGLATYALLSFGGRIAPRVLCTIQSGVLESPNKLMTRILKGCNETPKIWVRGTEEEKGFQPFLATLTFAKDSLYSVLAMNFQFNWLVGTSYASARGETFVQSKRHCKAYITEETYKKIQKQSFPKYKRNKILDDTLQNIVQKINPGSKLLICTQRIVQGVDLGKFAKVEFWENIFGNVIGDKISMSQSLQYLDSLSIDCLYEEVYFIPYGLEDEGVLLNMFMKKECSVKFFAILSKPLDFIDLRTP